VEARGSGSFRPDGPMNVLIESSCDETAPRGATAPICRACRSQELVHAPYARRAGAGLAAPPEVIGPCRGRAGPAGVSWATSTDRSDAGPGWSARSCRLLFRSARLARPAARRVNTSRATFRRLPEPSPSTPSRLVVSAATALYTPAPLRYELVARRDDARRAFTRAKLPLGYRRARSSGGGRYRRVDFPSP